LSLKNKLFYTIEKSVKTYDSGSFREWTDVTFIGFFKNNERIEVIDNLKFKIKIVQLMQLIMQVKMDILKL